MQQHHTPIKVPSALNRRHLPSYLLDLLYALHPLPDPLVLFAIQPLRIVFGKVYRAFEYPGPFEMRGVEVGVADDYGFQSALFVDEIHSRLVDEGDDVPEDVSLARLNEDGALAYAKLFLGRS